MTTQELWNAVLGELELEMSKPNFQSWCKDTFILSMQQETIVVGVPNGFTKQWFEKKYHTLVTTALRRILDHDVKKVSYEVASKQKANQNQEYSVADLQKPKEPAVEKKERTEHATVVIQKIAPLKNPTTTKEKGAAFGLNPRYTFENFIVGKKNELAHAACLAAADRPGVVYNPLFIYGGVGLGKTHLMQAVGHAVLEAMPDKKLLYVTCETFTNEYIKAVGEGGAHQFKEKYRSVDVLMVDDIQFLAGKEGTQEEFFHTFNFLHQYNKQVILTSDRPPRAIPTLEDRLASRFEGGMIVDVGPPDLETRIAIIEQKCKERRYHISQEVSQFIASNVQNNIRELEGALNRVIGHHQLKNSTPTVDSVKSILSSVSTAPKRGAVTPKKIITTVSEYFDVDEEAVKGSSRKKELVVPRQITMYLMREETHASFPNIGQELGGRDHTTAMHACTKVKRMIEEDEKMEHDIGMIQQRLYNS